MITIVKGDILEASENIIGHQVNCQGVMGAGLAKQIRNKYPIVYKRYKDECDSVHPMILLGRTQFVPIGERKVVANLYGQLNYGRKEGIRYTDYLGLYNALKSLRESAEASDITIALPYGIGCGLAGGEWDKVYKMIEAVFEGYHVTLYQLN